MPTDVRPLTRWHWLVPGALLAAGTAATWSGELDLAVARLVYAPSDPTHWPVGYEQPWALLYRWAVVPAIALAVAGLALLARSFLGGRDSARRASQRRAGLALLLSLALGPLLLVNGVLHETWGRPRPRHVTEFGGTKAFRPVLRPTWDPQAQSFPTGHAAGGYAVVALYFVLRARRPRLAWLALAAALLMGSVTAWARITQGGHWLSDGLWSAGVIWFAAWAVAWTLERRARSVPLPASPPVFRRWAAIACGVAALALGVGYLAALPLSGRVDRDLGPAGEVRIVEIELAGPPLEAHRVAAPDARVRVTTTLAGRGPPWAGLTDRWEPQNAGADTLRGRYTLLVPGYRRSQTLELWVLAPPEVQVTLRQAALP